MGMCLKRRFSLILWTRMCNFGTTYHTIPYYLFGQNFRTSFHTSPGFLGGWPPWKTQKYLRGKHILTDLVYHYHFFSTAGAYLSSGKDIPHMSSDAADEQPFYENKLGDHSQKVEVFAPLVEKKLSRKRKRTVGSIVLNDEFAQYLANVIRPCLNRSNGEIHEISAGPGIFTRALLEGGMTHLTAWEPEEQLFSSLLGFENLYPGRLTVKREVPVHTFGQKPLVDYEDWLSLWKQEPSVTLIAQFYCHDNYETFLFRLMKTLQNRTFPFHNGRPEILVLVGPLDYALMTLEKSQFKRKVPYTYDIYQLFWQVDTISKIPLERFTKNIFGKLDKVHLKKDFVDTNYLYVMRLTPRLDMFESVCSWKKLPGFLFMIKRFTRNNSQRLIPFIEQWCPGLGPVLLKMGYTMNDKVRDLALGDLPVIFKEIMAWPSESYSGLYLEMQKLCDS